ncbi:MAG TPA: HAD family hydrolase [Mycobacteriales bacterium]|nr:HAD family hydrolase [Mycobacteriales bacterium]
MPTGVLFDVDGTLVDTNYLHVVAWWQAFRSQGHQVAMTDLHRTVGQGSDQFVSSILGRDDKKVADAHSDFYGQWKHQLMAFPGAADLLRTTKKAGLSVVLATSASEAEAEHLTAAIDADDAIDVVTTKGDADASKPDPDIVQTALDKAGLRADDALFVGDTVWDVQAASRAGVRCVCVLSGGISETELREAGAIAVYRDVAHIVEEFDDSPLGQLTR